MTPKRTSFLCGPSSCPNDPNFEHDDYFGCVPNDFNGHTGRSKAYRQAEHDGRWFWNGGCAAIRHAGATS